MPSSSAAHLPATQMVREAFEAPAAVARLLAANAPQLSQLATRLRASPPRAVITCARGSSDCAATWLRYALEIQCGVLTSSFAPSVASVYTAAPHLAGSLFITLSQSGRSPDLLAATRAARESGALTVAFVNVIDSPLAECVDLAIPLHAGPERSVAATKSFIATLAASAQLVSLWSGDRALAESLDRLPQHLERAATLDWSNALPLLSLARSVYTLGRGAGLGIAQEAALKLKETCQIHAEAISAAEVLHGPLALAGPDLGALVFMQDDAARSSLAAAATTLVGHGASVAIAGHRPGACPAGALALDENALPGPALDPLLTPLLAIQSFYPLAAALSVARGLDPDSPPHLRKVTESL